MPLAGMHSTNRFEELLPHHSLHHIALCARSQSALDIDVTFKRCENNGTSGRRERQNVPDQLESSGVAKTKVDQRYVWVEFTKYLQRLYAGFCGANNLHIRLQRHNARQPFADDRMVVYTKNADSSSFIHPGSHLHLTALSSSILPRTWSTHLMSCRTQHMPCSRER